MKDIPDKFFELGIVDPPYGLERFKKGGSHLNKYGSENKEWNNKICKLISVVLILVSSFVLISAGNAAEQSAQAKEKQSVKSSKCYKLTSGKENKMCRLFQQNLNRFCKKQPFVCEPPIHPDFAKYFSVPKWETVDYKAHLDVIEQYIKIRVIIPIKCSANA